MEQFRRSLNHFNASTVVSISGPNVEMSNVVHGTAENLINKLEENLASAFHADGTTDPVSPDEV